MNISYTESTHYIRGSVSYFGDDITLGTRLLYNKIFDITNNAYPNLIKCFNYIPFIKDNYEKFNKGRESSFVLNKCIAYPAALGVEDSTLRVDFIATSYDIKYIDNSRQTEPSKYPLKHKPLFSRAVLVNGELFISGTASIVGHSSTNHNNITAQCIEINKNLQLITHNAGVSMDALAYTAYVKHANDVPIVKKAFPYKTRYIVTNMCREEILVEIEAGPING